MLKRFLCIFISFTIVFSVCFTSVYADDYSGIAGITQNDVEYFKKALELAKKLVRGEISVDDAYNEFKRNASDLVSENVKDFLHVDDVSDMTPRGFANEIVKGVGDKLKDLGGLLDGSPNKDEIFNMKGYGAVCVAYENGKYFRTAYGAYGIIHPQWGNQLILYPDSDSNVNVYLEYASGSIQNYSSSTVVGYYNNPNFPGNTYILYGDWRWADETKEDPVPTSPTYNIVYTTDPSGLTDSEILDLIKDMINQLNFDFPDLSTIEGLLNSILATLGTLDSDNDASGLNDIKNAIDNLGNKEEKDYTSILSEIKSALENLFNKEEKDYTSQLDDIKSLLSEQNYNELLNTINLAIVSLAKDNHTDNLEMIKLLNELKENLGNGGSVSDLSPILSALEKMQKSLDYLCAINTLELGEDILDDLTEEESEFLGEYAALVTTLISKFGLVPINNMLASLDAVILNNSAPSDLVINMYGQNITFLSSDMFNAEAMQYINLAKIFISVLLVYSFCLMFRRKIIGGG